MDDLGQFSDGKIARGIALGNLLCGLLAKETDDKSQAALHELQKQRLALIQEQRRRGHGPPDVVVGMKPIDLRAVARR